MKDAPNKQKEEECALVMVRHGVQKNVSMKDAPVMQREEESALSMEQRSPAAAMGGVPIKHDKQEFVLGMVQSKLNNMARVYSRCSLLSEENECVVRKFERSSVFLITASNHGLHDTEICRLKKRREFACGCFIARWKRGTRV